MYAYFRVATKAQLSMTKGGLSHEQIHQIGNGYPGQYQPYQPFTYRLAAETARSRLCSSLYRQ